MPIYLHRLPEPRDTVRHNHWRRWLLGLPLLIVIGCGISVLLWPQGHTYLDRRFAFGALGVPGAIWLLLRGLTLLRPEYCDAYNAGWNSRRAWRERVETQRSYRSAWVGAVASCSALGNTIAAPITRGEPLLAARATADGTVVRHTALPRPADWPYQPEAHLTLLFTELLQPCQPALNALPTKQRVQVALCMDSPYPQLAQKCWLSAWTAVGGRAADLLPWPAASGIGIVDSWLDKATDGQALLLVALQMYASPPADSAEAAAALLLVKSKTPPADAIAQLHRPSSGEGSLLAAIPLALAYGRADNASIAGVWQAGLDQAQRAAIASSNIELHPDGSNEERTRDIDTCIGNAGLATGLLAIAAACEQVTTTQQAQLVLAGPSAAAAAVVIQAVMPASSGNLHRAKS